MGVIAGEDASEIVLDDRSPSSSRFCAGAPPAREAACGLDGTGKLSKDMKMTAMSRIDAR